MHNIMNLNTHILYVGGWLVPAWFPPELWPQNVWFFGFFFTKPCCAVFGDGQDCAAHPLFLLLLLICCRRSLAFSRNKIVSMQLCLVLNA